MVKPTTPTPGTGNRPADKAPATLKTPTPKGKATVTLKTPTPKGKATGFYTQRFTRKDDPTKLCIVLDGPVPEVAWVSGGDLQ